MLIAMLTILAAEDAAAFLPVTAYSTSHAPSLRSPPARAPSSLGMMAEPDAGRLPSEATNNNAALHAVVSRRSALRAALAATLVGASVTAPGSSKTLLGHVSSSPHGVSSDQHSVHVLATGRGWRACMRDRFGWRGRCRQSNARPASPPI